MIWQFQKICGTCQTYLITTRARGTVSASVNRKQGIDCRIPENTLKEEWNGWKVKTEILFALTREELDILASGKRILWPRRTTLSKMNPLLLWMSTCGLILHQLFGIPLFNPVVLKGNVRALNGYATPIFKPYMTREMGGKVLKLSGRNIQNKWKYVFWRKAEYSRHHKKPNKI